MGVRETTVGTTRLRLVQGDITRIASDAIVNAANEELWPGGGVSGAIHRAGGMIIEDECRRIGHTPTGQAAITTGGRLPARYVIHAVGPIWKGGSAGEPELLASAYRSSLRLADEHGLKSIAFPSISTGIYGYPIEPAAKVAIETVIDYLRNETGLADVAFVLFSDGDLATYETVLDVVVQVFPA
ncbi:MAG: O-acetyl-ADP-ribose deacetylase [Chloroflexi bacterium]|nr:O-acetyl-ADP-ribose deacetylase [Chloroflexota bacterium]